MVVNSDRPRLATNTRPGSLIQFNGRLTCTFAFMRAAIYTRISRDEAGEGLGVARQREDCDSLLRRRGWTVVGEYCDNDLSAFTGRPRPAYQRLVRDLKAGLVQAVVAWAPERLHRSPRELEDFIQLLEETGAVVETVKAGTWDVSTSHGRLVARMLGAVSRAESERTGERVARAHAQAKQAGYWRGPIPFGMQASSEPGRPEPDTAQAAIVEEVFMRVLRGDALTRIASDFNQRGLLPRRGQRWTHTGIARLLASPALGGMVAMGGEFLPGVFEGVVSEQRWRAAQAALRRRPRGEARRPREKLTLLGGILACQEHGDILWGGGKVHAAVYIPGAPGLNCHVSITRAAADHFVERLVIARLEQPDAGDLLRMPTSTSRDDATEADTLRSRRDDLATLVAEGLLPAATARERLTSIAARLQELESALHDRPFSDIELIDPTYAWTTWTMPQRRSALRLLFKSVMVRHTDGRNGPRADPTRLTVTWARQSS